MESSSLESPSSREMLVFDFSSFLDPNNESEALRKDLDTKAEKIALNVIEALLRLRPGEEKIIAELNGLVPRRVFGTTDDRLLDRSVLLSHRLLSEINLQVKILRDKKGLSLEFGGKFLGASGNTPRFIIDELPQEKTRIHYRCRIIMPDPSASIVNYFRRPLSGGGFLI